MNRRRNLIATVLGVAAMVALLMPLERLLSLGANGPVDAKQAAVMQALERYEAWEEQKTPVDVLPAVDIEEIWALEDEREESAHSLVTSMYCGEDELGFDAKSQTFYCTLGLGNEDSWPEFTLSFLAEEGVSVVWLDDYSYDWCSDAIAEGYRYELFAYSQTEYAYIGVVFTGLPIVTMHAGADIGDTYVPGRVSVAAKGHEAIDSAALLRERGGGWEKPVDKWSYRMELHTIGANGTDEKNDVPMLGMKADSDWLLLANAQDRTTARSKIAWDIWNDWHADGSGMMCMENEMVELFIDDEYMGIYQLMQRVREEDEIVKVGGDLSTDSVFRLISVANESEKPLLNLKSDIDTVFEYRYDAHDDAQRAFDLAQDYIAMSRWEGDMLDDEAFEQMVLERVNIESLMDYWLFFHACQLRDNMRNNIFIYSIRQEDGRYLYYHAPWDMDTAFWTPVSVETEHNEVRWPDITMQLPKRILDLNIGNSREIIWKLWEEKRSTLLTNEAMYARFMEMEELLNASGAYRRDYAKWYGIDEPLNLSEMEYYQEMNLVNVGLTLEGNWPLEGYQAGY